MKSLFKGYLAGFISATLITSIVFAEPIKINIPAVFDNIKIYVDGILIKPKDAKGNSVEPFLYKGTTYLPVRAVSEALGKKITWNGNSKSVYIGKVPENKLPDPVSSFKTPEIEGIRIFPHDNFWNTPINNLPVHPKSKDYITTIGNGKTMHPDFGTVWEGAPIGIPYNVVPFDQPKVNVDFDYSDESDKGPYPIPKNPLIEAGSDRHILILQKGSNILYELFDARKNSDGSWLAGSGAIWHLDRNEYRAKGFTSADAAGMAILPGLVRWDEVYEKGEIKHAIRITLSKIQKAYIPPASHSGGKYKEQKYPPMGLRLRLNPDYDISRFDKPIQVILKAFKTYGVVVCDVGSDMYISGVPDKRWDDDVLRALKEINAGDFEAVYSGEEIPY